MKICFSVTELLYIRHIQDCHCRQIDSYQKLNKGHLAHLAKTFLMTGSQVTALNIKLD